MSALATRVVQVVADAKEPDVLIHLRFNPSGDVTIIDQQPQHLTVYEWYTRLCQGASNHYRALAGGRGFFRIPKSIFNAIVAKA